MNANLGASQFLRDKTVTTWETATYVTDTATGEIIKSAAESTKRIATEPDYIKVYYKAMMAVQGIDEIPLDFVLAISSQLGYINDEQPLLFYNNKTTRRAIADYCAIGDNMVQKYLKRCVMKGVLFSTTDRGTYEVNPWLIARGKWSSIRKLQAAFEFVDGTWTRSVTMAPRNTEDETTTTAAIPANTDNNGLSGQISLNDLEVAYG